MSKRADQKADKLLHHGKMLTGEAGLQASIAASAPSFTSATRGSLSGSTRVTA